MLDKKFLVIVSVIMAVFIITAAYWFRLDSQKRTDNVPVVPTAGREGTTHRHMSIVVLTPDGVIDFSAPEYQLQSPLVHFEEEDGTFIHKHALGVTLPFLFETLGMTLTPECLTLDGGKSYCTNETNKLHIFINRVERNKDIPFYELLNNDKYLITYGSFSSQDLQLQLNSVPDLEENLESY